MSAHAGTDRLVLCYHAVSDDWPSPLAVRPAALAQQLGWLVRRGYRGVTFTQATGAPAGRVVAVTFDDACRSVLALAAPILARLGLPGTVFVPTDFVGCPEPMRWPGIEQWSGTPHAQELRCLGWDELEALRALGWEIGSHTRSHPDLRRLDDDKLRVELEGSRRLLAERCGPCRSLALPYGYGDQRVVAAAEAAGYEAVAGLPEAGSGPPAGWPRVGVYGRDGMARFRLKAGRVGRHLRGSALGRPGAAAARIGR